MDISVCGQEQISANDLKDSEITQMLPLMTGSYLFEIN